MKFKATKKQMSNGYNKIISIGYCDAQYLLQYQEPIAYSAGTCGWSCDYYEVDRVLIATGYSPVSEKNTKRDYEYTLKIDKAAREIIFGNESYEVKRDRVNALLNEYVKTLTSK